MTNDDEVTVDVEKVAFALYQKMRERDAELAEAEAAREYDDWEARTVEYESQKVNELRRERDELAEQVNELGRAAKKHKVLSEAIDYLDGRITHVVRPGYSKMIEPIEEAVVRTDAYGRREYQLIGLLPYHDRDGHLKINTYSDGSGAWTDVIPCKSLDEAHRVVRELFAADVALWQKRDTLPHGSPRQHLKTTPHAWLPYRDSGVELDWPAELIELLNEQILSGLRKRVTSADEAYKKARAELSKAKLFKIEGGES